ncbi:MAG: hypothetical protein ACR2O8_16370, partial [Rhizobiaceae bacterium]
MAIYSVTGPSDTEEDAISGELDADLGNVISVSGNDNANSLVEQKWRVFKNRSPIELAYMGLEAGWPNSPQVPFKWQRPPFPKRDVNPSS